ncbi:MAG TPA: hypothetical protein VF511_09840 [Chthoniobacterales bacterium]|jgi:hypothetical protein
MVEFLPVNSLETKLRSLLRDKNTPSWDFYTPLAAATLWIFARQCPELDGSDLIAPEGKNPEICTFTGPEGSVIGIYTAECRAEEAFARFKLAPATFHWISAKGYELLRFLNTFKESELWMNFGLPECHYHLDPDMVEILLSRGEPSAPDVSTEKVTFAVEGNPEQYLGPLKEFLRNQPTVRAAWILSPKSTSAKTTRSRAYELHLVMRDPEDNSLLEKVRIMAKALTPIEMEWQSAVMLADDNSFRRLAEQSPPFYQAPNFLR